MLSTAMKAPRFDPRTAIQIFAELLAACSRGAAEAGWRWIGKAELTGRAGMFASVIGWFSAEIRREPVSDNQEKRGMIIRRYGIIRRRPFGCRSSARPTCRHAGVPPAGPGRR